MSVFYSLLLLWIAVSLQQLAWNGYFACRILRMQANWRLRDRRKALLPGHSGGKEASK